MITEFFKEIFSFEVPLCIYVFLKYHLTYDFVVLFEVLQTSCMPLSASIPNNTPCCLSLLIVLTSMWM